MNTLSIGSLARNTFTFCCTKCFFLVLVLGASMTIGLEALPVLPRDAIITVGHSPVTQQQRSVFLSDPPPSVPAPVPLTDNQRSNSTSAKLSHGGRCSVDSRDPSRCATYWFCACADSQLCSASPRP